MIEREPFLIRNGLRIFSIVAVVGILVLVIIGVRFQVENAEFEGEERRLRSRPPTVAELQESCAYFQGAFLGMPTAPRSRASPGLFETCNLRGTVVQQLQCVHYRGDWRGSACSVDVDAVLQELHP